MSARSLSLALLVAVLIGCGGGVQKGASTPAAAAAPKLDVAAPGDLSPNVLRDRRGHPGVRSAPKSLVIGKPDSVKCGKLTKAPPDADHADLLGGRLRVRPPASAKVPAPLPDAPSIEEESRVIADGGKVSLAIVARETFQLDPDLYEPDADAPAKPGKLDIEAPKFLKATFPSEEPLEISPVELGTRETKMRAYVARPPQPNAPPGKDTALVLALLIAQDDGALESVGFYVRGETVRNAVGDELVGCTRLAERIASTIAPGPRKLERAAGQRHVADVSNEEVLTVTVPADYVVIPSPAGAKLVKLRPLSLYPGSINVSIADAADKAPAVPEGADATAPGKLLGRAVEWRGKTTPTGGFFFATEPLDTKEKSKTAAVLVKATRQAKALEEMRGVAETLTLVKRAP